MYFYTEVRNNVIEIIVEINKNKIFRTDQNNLEKHPGFCSSLYLDVYIILYPCIIPVYFSRQK